MKRKLYLWLAVMISGCSYNGFQENTKLVKDYTLHEMQNVYRDVDKKNSEAYSEFYVFEFEGKIYQGELPHTRRFYSKNKKYYARIITILGPRGKPINQHVVLFHDFGYPDAMFSMMGRGNKMEITQFDDTGIYITIVNWEKRTNSGLNDSPEYIKYFTKKKHKIGDIPLHFTIDYKTDFPYLPKD